MKIIYKIILIFLVLWVQSCNLQHKLVASKETKKKVEEQYIDALIIPSDFFLENRVENCDSALLFMKAVIKPCALQWNNDANTYFTSFWDGFRIPGESKVFLGSSQKVGTVLYKNNERFYISLNCLIGQNFQVVLDIFVKPEFHDAIIHDIKLQETDRNFFTIEATGFTSFSIIIVDGVVSEASFDVQTISH